MGEGSKDGMEKVPEGWDPGSVSWEGRAHRRVLGESDSKQRCLLVVRPGFWLSRRPGT